MSILAAATMPATASATKAKTMSAMTVRAALTGMAAMAVTAASVVALSTRRWAMTAGAAATATTMCMAAVLTRRWQMRVARLLWRAAPTLPSAMVPAEPMRQMRMAKAITMAMAIAGAKPLAKAMAKAMAMVMVVVVAKPETAPCQWTRQARMWRVTVGPVRRCAAMRAPGQRTTTQRVPRRFRRRAARRAARFRMPHTRVQRTAQEERVEVSQETKTPAMVRPTAWTTAAERAPMMQTAAAAMVMAATMPKRMMGQRAKTTRSGKTVNTTRRATTRTPAAGTWVARAGQAKLPRTAEASQVMLLKRRRQRKATAITKMAAAKRLRERKPTRVAARRRVAVMAA
mmetsp:Transcript_36921/g.108861  ORF Transcript_36921/g.108861 Transcript_36921/m.108861 type:complete len:344 (+) Transcript_36921:348-1379(+)